MPKEPTRAQIDALKVTFAPGTRVRLIEMDDTQAPPIGTEGNVIAVDDIGTIHVQWDNGSSLGVVYGEDKIEMLDSVETICYGQRRKWKTRSEALAFFTDCMLNSEGAEQERYLEIYIDLMAGKTLCLDEKSAKK